ncbi:protease-associated domain-containing protein 1 isoform X1 [Tachypleus tridentatus]|uniref:protease-associated domain-containing protein 1 isoform X1 n=1 Tax=Tachypleus tridentatus TaxID=6853 RepID=UPI003FD64E40
MTNMPQKHVSLLCLFIPDIVVLPLILFEAFVVVSGIEISKNVKQDIFFEIVEPESLRYTFKVRPAQDFGVYFNEPLQNVGLVISEPHHGCSAPINKLELKNNVILVERGGCSFLTKCIQGEHVGALAVIVADSDIKNDEQYIEMIDDNTQRNCSIPAMFLLGKDGYMIRQRLEAHGLSRAIINIPVNITMVPLQQQKQPPWLIW